MTDIFSLKLGLANTRAKQGGNSSTQNGLQISVHSCVEEKWHINIFWALSGVLTVGGGRPSPGTEFVGIFPGLSAS